MAVFLAANYSQLGVAGALAQYNWLVPSQPWRLLTSAFMHNGFLHLGVNMWSLYSLGPTVEATEGRGRFLALYAASGVAGAAGGLPPPPCLAALPLRAALRSIEWPPCLCHMQSAQQLAAPLPRNTRKSQAAWPPTSIRR